MNEFTIRKAKLEDARGIHDAHVRSIREVCAQYYSDDQIRVWSMAEYNEEGRQRAIQEHEVWVVESEGIIEGFGQFVKSPTGELRGSLRALYLTPKASGKNIGKRVMHEILKSAKESGLTELTLQSSTNAVSFYEKCGFEKEGDQKVLTWSGVEVPCQNMKMSLHD